jgi:ubiquinone/menaquinone biosynthesis C-methylase UbiE
MKVEDSGMPHESYWNSLFNIEGIIAWLPPTEATAKIVEIGCGYGTFTLPLAKMPQRNIHTFDIESSMIDIARHNATDAGLSNIRFEQRDVLEQGTGLEERSVDMVLLFNILHFEEKGVFLEEAARILKRGGTAAIVHWRTDIPTPRGPAVSTRPDAAQILEAAKGLDLHYDGVSGTLEPYHWGMQLAKGTDHGG